MCFMEKFIKIVLFSILLMGYSFLSAQTKKRVYFAMDDIELSTVKEIKRLSNVLECKIVYGDFIYPNKSKVLVEDVFRKEINRLFPNSQSSGVGMLDWEGQLYHDLFADKATEEQKINAAKEFVRAVKIAKKIRPNIKWGFYSIPNPLQYHYTEASRKYLKMILDECDVVMPSFYLQSKSETPNRKLFNLFKFLTDVNINKPIYPIIWDRYSTTDKALNYDLINETVFFNYINQLKADSRFSGIIYWGRDTWFSKYDIERGKAMNKVDFVQKYNRRILKNVKQLNK